MRPPITQPATMYLTGCTNPPTAAAAHSQRRLGMLAQPGNAIHKQAHHYSAWGIDNGAFGHARKVAQGLASPWAETESQAFLQYLRRLASELDTSQALFAVAPDVLRFVCLTHDFADTARELSCGLRYGKAFPPAERCKGVPIGEAQPTWERGRGLFPQIRQLGFKPALVAQDGILETSPMNSEWDEFDVLFLGGSDQFKLGPQANIVTQLARERGKWVHMGRVNSFKRLQIAQEMGCDSVDGTFIGFGPSKNLPKVLDWLTNTEPAPALAAA